MSGGVDSISTDNGLAPPPPTTSQVGGAQEDPQPNASNPKPAKKRLLSLRQLNCLALLTILSSSGLVNLGNFTFLLFSIIYTFFLSKFSFPPSPPSTGDTPIFSPSNKILRVYITVGAIIGLYLPIAYIFEGVYVGDKEEIKAAASHLFLLASQIFMEGVVFSGEFGIPVRVFVPVFFNSKRVFEIVEWLRSEMEKSGGGGEFWAYERRRLLVGRALAVANLAFWCFNLFGFLIPVYIPRAFKRYYYSSKAH